MGDLETNLAPPWRGPQCPRVRHGPQLPWSLCTQLHWTPEGSGSQRGVPGLGPHLWVCSNLHTSLAGGHCNDPHVTEQDTQTGGLPGSQWKVGYKARCVEPRSSVPVSLLDLPAKSNVPSGGRRDSRVEVKPLPTPSLPGFLICKMG